MKTGTFRRIMIVLSPVLSIGRDCRLGINRYMREQQPSWRIVSHPGWRFADERWLGRWTSPVDGAIVWNFGKISYKGWRGRRTRIIGIINYDLEGKAPIFVTDDRDKGRAAAEHLLALETQQFAYIQRPGKLSSLRAAGFMDTLVAAGKRRPAILTVDDNEPPRHFGKRLALLRKTAHGPVGLMAYNDSIGAFAADACHEVGLSIPGDVAIVGVDNDELICDSASPALSSVQAPCEQLGYLCAQALDQLLETGKSIPDVNILSGGCFVFVRGSTRRELTTDAVLAKALSLINARFRDPIGVPDLCRHLAIPRRTLEYRFRQVLGHGPYEQILKMRIDHAKVLLVDTAKSIQKIAIECGFNSSLRMSRNFHRQTGLTPGQFRDRFQEMPHGPATGPATERDIQP